MNLKRIFKHLVTWPWRAKAIFPSAALAAIEEAIRESENTHRGEIRFVIEASLDLINLLQNKTPRERALEVFSSLRVWDTEDDTGILIYLLLADRQVEIVADRGIHAHVGQSGWEEICHEMEQYFGRSEFQAGVILGIRRMTDLLKLHFPSTSLENNELTNKPMIL